MINRQKICFEHVLISQDCPTFAYNLSVYSKPVVYRSGWVNLRKMQVESPYDHCQEVCFEWISIEIQNHIHNAALTNEHVFLTWRGARLGVFKQVPLPGLPDLPAQELALDPVGVGGKEHGSVLQRACAGGCAGRGRDIPPHQPTLIGTHQKTLHFGIIKTDRWVV